MRARVAQVLPLEVDLRAAQLFAKAFGEIERRRPSHEVAQIALEHGLERRVVLRLEVGRLEFVQSVHQRLGDELAAVGPVAPVLIRPGMRF